MVNYIIVSEFEAASPAPAGRQKVAGPLYALERVQSLSGKVVLWTRRCQKQVQALAMDTGDMAELLQELTADDYIDSEWCSNGKQAWAACDAYRLRRREWMEHVDKYVSVEYFLKFAIGRTGAVILIASCHLSQ